MANFLRDYQGLYVNGKWIAPESAAPVINPATEQAIARIPVGDQRTLDEAIAAARTAFDEGPWPRMRPAERSALLMQFHGELAARSEEIASLVVAESGASQMLARFLHVQSSLEIFRTAVELAARREMMVPLAPQVTPSFSGGKTLGVSVKVREPAGVVAAITPFNFPFFLNLVKIGPALAAGCTVVLKPSPLTPVEALMLGDVADQVGLPGGVLNVITGGASVGERLTTDPRIDVVTFTGSDGAVPRTP